MSAQDHPWGADTPVSRPITQDEHPSIVDLGGFGFGMGGVTYHATDGDIEDLLIPHFAPPFTSRDPEDE